MQRPVHIRMNHLVSMGKEYDGVDYGAICAMILDEVGAPAEEGPGFAR